MKWDFHKYSPAQLAHLRIHPCKPIPFSLLPSHHPATTCISSSIAISSAAMIILEMRLYVSIAFAFLQLLYHSFKGLPCSPHPGLSGTVVNCYVKLASWKPNFYPAKIQTDNYGWSLRGASSQTVPGIAWWSSVCPRAKLCQGLCKRYTQWTIESSPDVV